MVPRARPAVVLAGASLLAASLLLVVGGRLLAGPLIAAPTLDEAAAGLRVQHIVAQLLLREAGLTSRADPLAVSPAEANVFLARHLRLADPPAWPLRVRLGAGWVELEGSATLGRLLERAGLPGLARVLPSVAREHPVWLALRGRLVTWPGRGELVPEGARVGRQGVPVAWLWRIVGAPPGGLTWAMPRVIDRVDVTPEAVVIHTRPRPTGTRGPA